VAFFVPTLFCHAQDKEPVGKPAQVNAPVATAPPVVPPAPTVPTMAAGTAADAYVIGASDVLTVTVWKEPTLSGSILVRPDGMISLPLLGDVQASGLTPLQLADQIATKLKKFIQDPNVSVVISQIHSKVIYLLGEVGKKGPIEMTPGMTLLEAIASAGGVTDYANTKKIYILRDEAGKHQKIPVHYKEALKGDSTLDLVLKPGDTIVVP
jgi:polysaccharide export outer membrane protein